MGPAERDGGRNERGNFRQRRGMPELTLFGPDRDISAFVSRVAIQRLMW